MHTTSTHKPYTYLSLKYDERGVLGSDSFTVGSAYKLLVRVYSPRCW